MTDPSLLDEHFAEQFPLSPLDDFMVHQTPDPVRVSWTGDPRAYERYWMVAHDATGEVMVATGGSIYPNLDRAEAYAVVVRGAGTPPCAASARSAWTAPTSGSVRSPRRSSGVCGSGGTCWRPTTRASAGT